MNEMRAGGVPVDGTNFDMYVLCYEHGEKRINKGGRGRGEKTETKRSTKKVRV
jgi:hypothetical protein